MSNEAAMRALTAAFGDPIATDGKTNLFDSIPEVDASTMRAIANAAHQPVSMELNKVGDIKIMEDGTQWKLSPNGWYKIPV